ncbi:MAG: sodium:alanine symporter family protein [Parachlamydiaceae bacterium]|nr:sodium:alanine symporter family protein [Parachlamydiaceae bacterium]
MSFLINFFSFLEGVEDILWGYFGVPMLMLVGLYITIQSNFLQLRKLPYILRQFIKLMRTREHDERGIHPLKAFFASVGGCVGIGNIAGICTAVQIGGPGALFWIWVTAFLGMMIKYSEVFLGLRYRVPNDKGGYNGGPMYFLQRVFKTGFVPNIVCLLLCVYGVEVYQFTIVTDSIVTNLHLDKYMIISVFLVLILFASSGGVRRVGNISSAIIPLFVVIYIGMGMWVLMHRLEEIPHVFATVFSAAFSGSAAMGGFIGSTMMLAVSQGVRRGCYTGDLGVGYASVIHSESSVKVPQEQASLAIIDIFLDTFIICTTSVLLILVTDVWQQPIGASMMVQTALSGYFPYMHLFMPAFFFLLGYSTINAYFCVGLKCAEFLSPRRGRVAYYLYACLSFITFSFVGINQAQAVMAIANGLLLVINAYGIFRLRKEISYDLGEVVVTAESGYKVAEYEAS